MKHTLKEFLETYDAVTIQLRHGVHLISIDTRFKGSYTLIKTFEPLVYNFVYFDSDRHLVLEY